MVSSALRKAVREINENDVRTASCIGVFATPLFQNGLTEYLQANPDQAFILCNLIGNDSVDVYLVNNRDIAGYVMTAMTRYRDHVDGMMMREDLDIADILRLQLQRDECLIKMCDLNRVLSVDTNTRPKPSP